MNYYATIRELVKSILEHPEGRDWTIQGLGMLRTYITPELRLHIWDSLGKVADVSEMHTHPWDFTSIVIAGLVHNTRYKVSTAEINADAFAESINLPFMEQTIKCGEGGGLIGSPRPLLLTAMEEESFTEGQIYRQDAEEIHVSRPLEGTVTLIRRTFREDTEHAYVYWPLGQEWVSAEPRPAEPSEISMTCQSALETWF